MLLFFMSFCECAAIHVLKVIMATNRIETLDPALIRPGRIDRKIEFPLPDEKTKRRIFSIHTNRMTLAEDVTLEDYVMAKDDLSGADIKVRLTLPHCPSVCHKSVMLTFHYANRSVASRSVTSYTYIIHEDVYFDVSISVIDHHQKKLVQFFFRFLPR